MFTYGFFDEFATNFSIRKQPWTLRNDFTLQRRLFNSTTTDWFLIWFIMKNEVSISRKRTRIENILTNLLYVTIARTNVKWILSGIEKKWFKNFSHIRSMRKSCHHLNFDPRKYFSVARVHRKSSIKTTQIELGLGHPSRLLMSLYQFCDSENYRTLRRRDNRLIKVKADTVSVCV